LKDPESSDSGRSVYIIWLSTQCTISSPQILNFHLRRLSFSLHLASISGFCSSKKQKSSSRISADSYVQLILGGLQASIFRAISLLIKMTDMNKLEKYLTEIIARFKLCHDVFGKQLQQWHRSVHLLILFHPLKVSAFQSAGCYQTLAEEVGSRPRLPVTSGDRQHRPRLRLICLRDESILHRLGNSVEQEHRFH
jgi:hypothetical protein